jgi:hypothetical protein
LGLILASVPGTGFAAALACRGFCPLFAAGIPAERGGLVVNLLVLVALLGLAVAVVTGLRRGWFGGDGFGGFGGSGGAGRGDWEKTLVGYKNLRDEGVLSEEEFRKIRTLVEPHARTGTPELRARQWPPQDPVGPEEARN